MKLIVSVILFFNINAFAAPTFSTDGQDRLNQIMQVLNHGPVKEFQQIFYSGRYASSKKSCLAMIDVDPQSIYFFIKQSGQIDMSWSRNLGVSYPINLRVRSESAPELSISDNKAFLIFTTEMKRTRQLPLIETDEVIFETSDFGFENLTRLVLANTSPENNMENKERAVRVEHDCTNLVPVFSLNGEKYQKIVDMALAKYNRTLPAKEHREAIIDNTFECTLLAPDKLTCDINLETEDSYGGNDVLHVNYLLRNRTVVDVTDLELEPSH